MMRMNRFIGMAGKPLEADESAVCAIMGFQKLIRIMNPAFALL
jgi:hypothetical protein